MAARALLLLWAAAQAAQAAQAGGVQEDVGSTTSAPEETVAESQGSCDAAQPCPVAPPSEPLDALLDFAIALAAHKYALLRGRRLPMDDIGQGRLRLSEGSIGGLRSVFRQGPVSLRRAVLEGRPSLLINFSVGLRSVDVHYRYHYSIPLFTHSGYVQGALSPVAVEARALLQAPCRARLLRLEVAALGPLALNGTGFWPLNGVVFGLLRELAARTLRGALLGAVADARAQLAADLAALRCAR